MIKTRIMRREDAKRVAEINIQSWQKAYEGIVSDEYLRSMDSSKRAENWSIGFDVNEDVVRIVAVKNKLIVGYAAGLENRYKDKFPEIDCELWAIYVDPLYWSKGIGTTLFEEFSKRMCHLKYHSMLVWVLEKNISGRRFYEKNDGIFLAVRKMISLRNEEHTEVAYKFQL